MNLKFYVCGKCNELIYQFGDESKEIVCCEEKMKEIIPNTVEASVEKHVPVLNVDGNKLDVQVGVIPHPQTEEHYISFIAVKCGNNVQIRHLTPKDSSIVTFYGEWKGNIEVQAYCNLHGSWLSTIIC